MNYYNEFDPGAAAWLRELIRAGLIPDGHVDERSIEDVKPQDLNGYAQCHFFAGIGGWPLALQTAGWPDDRPVWTGSCPCQPYSAAGARHGNDDPRNLWWAFRWLIDTHRPTTVFGEQVASKAGREWFAGVRADLEALAYACGGADLCAAGVGAPHIRQRLFWVGHTSMQRRNGQPVRVLRRGQNEACTEAAGNGDGGWLAHSNSRERQRQPDGKGCQHNGEEAGRVESNSGVAASRRSGEFCAERLAHSEREGLEGHAGHGDGRGEPGREQAQAPRSVAQGGGDSWGGIYVPCADGKARRIEPGIKPLAHGIPARVVRLRGYGNAIVPQVAAAFIAAAMEASWPA